MFKQFNTDKMNLGESHRMQPFHVQAEIYIYDLKAPNTPVYIISIHHLGILRANKNKFLKIICYFANIPQLQKTKSLLADQ